MATLTKRTKSSKAARGSIHPSLSRENEAEFVNVEALRGIISYLNYLYAEGEISDNAYKALVSQVLSTFVANSIEFKVEQLIDRLDQAIEDAGEALLRDFWL